MTTIKTPLPSKVTGPDTVGLGYWPHQVHAMRLDELEKSHNQLIDYLTERAVVEGKQDEYTRGRIDEAKTCQGCSKERMTTLKEQLLGEIDILKRRHNCPPDDGNDYDHGAYVALTDVEAAINRIIK